MEDKKYWVAIQTQKNGKYYALVMIVREYDNLWAKLRGIPGIISANIFDTRKAARATVTAWNESFQRNGEFMFDTMPDGSPAPF